MPSKLSKDYSFSITPKQPYIDEDIHIRLSGCEPGEIVTIRAKTLDDEHQPFASFATFRADPEGVIDLSSQKPMNGTYKEKDSMGLFWSMEYTGKGNKLFIKTTSCPITTYLTAEVGKDVIAGTQVTRMLEQETIHKIELNNNGIVGTLYRPKASNAYPAVIILGGSDGAVHEQAAAMLASKGYVALALAYFGREGLPEGLINIPLEYFGGAIDWLQQLTFVNENKIGVIGFSRGAEVALLLGSVYPSIQTIIAASPNGLVFSGIKDYQPVNQSAWTYKGKEIAYFHSNLKIQDVLTFFGEWMTGQPISNLDATLKAIENRKKVYAARIPVEKINCPVLLLSGEDDQLIPASKFSKMVVRKLANKQSKHISFKDAGHFSSFPYALPNIPTNELISNRARMKMTFGGSKEANNKAANESWHHIVHFLDQYLKSLNNPVKISYMK
ncbi:acyl-CoA thioester hydrolase/BAAT C-terminal domain-containing protein [Oceanobacillus bengalensis]|uniref:Acyl-CoA thioesterase n=1 Tax=Oceanobacillus bengalensis TaxID=1435466 RepID=A0A494Z3Q2_9BACI|nr:acyl-CoA thioester hydrolase/BAAT C-terminal domain-containing protein [Oceanobacillus bengalensis]RKQ17147.1 hypothetical protein D8M05_05650 [Oceanobacillus bengalensis]